MAGFFVVFAALGVAVFAVLDFVALVFAVAALIRNHVTAQIASSCLQQVKEERVESPGTALRRLDIGVVKVSFSCPAAGS